MSDALELIVAHFWGKQWSIQPVIAQKYHLSFTGKTPRIAKRTNL
jgi:hypothetical protein